MRRNVGPGTQTPCGSNCIWLIRQDKECNFNREDGSSVRQNASAVHAEGTDGSGQCSQALQIEQFPQPLGLRAAHRNLGLLLVVHAQLVAGLEPRHHFADVVDVHHKAAMGAPETRRVQQLQQLFEGAALGLALEGAASRRESRPRRWPQSRSPPGPPAAAGSAPAQSAWPAGRARSAPCGRLSRRSSASSCDSISPSGAPAAPPHCPAGGDAGPGALHGLQHAGAVKGLQQVVHGVHVEGAHGVLVVGGGKHNLRQGRSVFLRAAPSPRVLGRCAPSAAG